jgi:hypothetical protein
MGRDVVSDFPFNDLPGAGVDGAAMSVMEGRETFPEPGALVREMVMDHATNAVIRVFEGPSGIHYSADNVGCFWIEPTGTRVWYRAAAGARPADIEHLLIGPVIGLALQLQGHVLLHASAVVVDGAAVAFAAPHGSGKSTLAASFVRAGHPLLTDDVLPLAEHEGGVRAMHSVARMKLWDDSLAALGEDHHHYDHAVSWLEKRRVRVGESWGEVAPGDLPLSAVYLLAPHQDSRAAIEFRDLTPVQAALQLVGNMYMAELLSGERAVRALDVAARMAPAVRIKRVSYRRSYDNLQELRASILADARRDTVAT